ncbi:MAG: DUF1598 domain-containing protein [Rubripirellula sp.]
MAQLRPSSLRSLLACLAAIAAFSAPIEAQEVGQHLAAGEFSKAKRIALGMPADARDPVLAQIASAQGGSGDVTAASGTIKGIDSSQSRGQAIDEVSGGAGGGSFADFQSLMDLIQTTVVPETWEALGGPSTMAPYPQGVFVDAAGTVLPCETFARTDAAADLKSMLSRAGGRRGEMEEGAWRQPAKMRCVSLRRLLDEWTHHRVQGAAMSESMTNLAGLSHVQYMFIDQDDVVLAGPVGGIDAHQGWYQDRESGLNTLRLDFLATCMASTLDNQPFGCTIDPTTEGLQQAAAVGVAVQANKIPIGKAADAMVAALGMQRVEVFGTAGDTPIGYLMVEADRHMKQLALGMQPMPRGAKSYLDVIDATIAKGSPDELLLRLWFTSSPRAVRADHDRKVFEIAGTPIRLSGQNERAMATGARGNVVHDFRTDAFVSDFNKNWPAIRSKYPVYGALESIYRSASVAELLRLFGEDARTQALVRALAVNGSSSDYLMRTPRQVETIAVLHSVRHGKSRHNVVVASGGVAVDSQQTLVSKITNYPSLASMTKPEKSRPKLVQAWWWNAKP